MDTVSLVGFKGPDASSAACRRIVYIQPTDQSDKLRDRDVAEVRLDVANLVARNAERNRDLTRRWQLEHDTIVGFAAQVGELDRRGAWITARRDQQLETVYRRLDMLEGAIGEIRTEFAAIKVRLDILLGREGQRMREDMRTPRAVPPAMRAGYSIRPTRT